MAEIETSEPLDFFAHLAYKFRPEVAAFQGEERMALVTDVIGVLLTLPLSLAGVMWLLLVSDWALVLRQWPMFFLVAVLSILLSRWRFYIVTDLGAHGGGTYGNAASSLEGVIRWSATFLFGPTILWLDLSISAARLLVALRRANTSGRRWVPLRTFFFSVTGSSLFPLLALAAYRSWGGTFPLADLTLGGFLLGAGTVGVQFFLENLLLWTGYLGYTLWKIRHALPPRLLITIIRLLAFGLLIPLVSNLFAAPLAAMYVVYGPPIYLMFALAVVLMSWLAHRMSQAMEDSRSQTVQLEKLEILGRAILNAPPDNDNLPELLTEYAAAMFTYARMAIWIEPGRWLLKQPQSWDTGEIDATRKWLAANAQACVLTDKDVLPWRGGPAGRVQHRPMVIAPILAVESDQVLGGVYLELVTLNETRSRRSLLLLLPTVQALAAQVSSALHQVDVYRRLLAHQKTQSELAFARRIQNGFLPAALPQVAGWQLTASLEPARQMAGDFYDVIALPSGKLGLVIADVADKGVGPALYMALSRTLIRTFAMQYETQPDMVFQAANERILQDAGESLFVTAFYGVLDPETGLLTYVNAGHNPPWLLGAHGQLMMLNKPRLPLGIDGAMRWPLASLTFAPGDLLFLYTDGASDAGDAHEAMFGIERLCAVLRTCCGLSAEATRAAVLESIRAFAGDAPQFDDITLLVVKREAESNENER
ncbi:MAG: PP2C family protein-serine/threonine phosphatase [Chloroflexota bacterium]